MYIFLKKYFVCYKLMEIHMGKVILNSDFRLRRHFFCFTAIVLDILRQFTYYAYFLYINVSYVEITD
jgi:hypothetical protein